MFPVQSCPYLRYPNRPRLIVSRMHCHNPTGWSTFQPKSQCGLYLKDNVVIPVGRWPTKAQILPIIFLSRSLTVAESNYWPTELEIAGLVWVLKKIRHLA